MLISQKKVKFLGRIVSKDGYSAYPENTQAVKDMQPPRSPKELTISQGRFGRFVWLRDFISSNIGESVAEFAFSNVMKEMTRLSKGKKFIWNEKAQNAFETAKNRLSDEKIIFFADFSLPFILITDASNFAVAGVLMQIQNGKQRIISCVSKTLDETQCRWSATERECYAIVFAIEKLAYFLKGPKTFTLLTDHKSLSF